MSELRVERDDASAPFFDAAKDGRLLIRRCLGCGRYLPPQQTSCVDGGELEWVTSSGSATLITWAVDHAPSPSPALLDAGGSATVIGVVELAEGPWMNCALPGVDPAVLVAGMAMRVEFLDLGEPVAVFRPA
jgi:uncharacterized OB-fold protein